MGQIFGTNMIDIKVYILPQGSDYNKIDLAYDPPISSWRFDKRLPEELEYDLKNVMQQFVYSKIDDRTKNIIINAIENKLKEWLYRGDLYIDPMYKLT
jgi:hypothetical protein